MWDRVPDPVSDVVETLRSAGSDAWITGESAAALVSERAPRPRGWRIETPTTFDALLARFRRAIPIAVSRDGRRGHALLAGRAGPLDLVARGPVDAASALGASGFTLLAIGIDPVARRIDDPFEGRADLRAGVVRRCAEDRVLTPLSGVRAARLCAEWSASLAPGLAAAFAPSAGATLQVPAEQLRAELDALLLAPRPSRGIAALRALGIEAALFGPLEDAGACVDAIAADPLLRWAAWMRERPPLGRISRLRLPAPRLRRLQQLTRLHPIDEALRREPATTLRALRRGGPAFSEALIALRRAELEALAAPPELYERLDACVARIEADRSRARSDAIELALDGRAVMEASGLSPGPEVGRILETLRSWVAADARRNDPERLRERLRTLLLRESDGD